MANKKNLTTFQKLGVIFDNGSPKQNAKLNKYTIKNDNVFKTKDKEEYETKKLEQQQNKYLSGLWHKVGNESFEKTVHAETSRISAYSDFENMEYFPEISAALDCFMEESCTLNKDGKMLNIYSESKRVKKILNDLFYNRLDIHTSLPMWTRNTVKYGDNFVFLDLDSESGVKGCKQMHNIEIERSETGLDTMLKQTAGNKSENKTEFIWREKGITFKSWQMAHFRLLTDDRRLPYGVSALEKARRIYRQLLLSEDAMLTYRVTRAPERRVYKVFVGNIDDADVPAYINEIANRFKRTPVFDPQTGQIDTRYNQAGNDQDFFIPVRDENAPNPIDTLPGATNLSDIEDLEFLQNKLLTALRVPKPFLGFDNTTGDGKNLALQDIRFTRTVNRIQQAIIQELNKIAIIHLYLLGLEDELDNFTLTLNNPSTQADMLRIEFLQQKLTAYENAVRPLENGFAAYSATRAKREILGMSNDEIMQDLLEQRIERATANELENTPNVIKYTGTFDKVDKIYGDMDIARMGGNVDGAEEGDEGGSPAGGGGGGGFAGGGGLDLGDEGGDLDDLNFGEEPEDMEGEAPEGGEDMGGEDMEAPEDITDSIKKRKNILAEQKKQLQKKLNERSIKHQLNAFERLVNFDSDKEPESVKFYDKHVKHNSDVDNMINEIENKVGKDNV